MNFYQKMGAVLFGIALFGVVIGAAGDPDNDSFAKRICPLVLAMMIGAGVMVFAK